MKITVHRNLESCVLEMRDTTRKVTLPTGHTIPLDMIGVVHLTPTGRVGVPATMPDKPSAARKGRA